MDRPHPLDGETVVEQLAEDLEQQRTEVPGHVEFTTCHAPFEVPVCDSETHQRIEPGTAEPLVDRLSPHCGLLSGLDFYDFKAGHKGSSHVARVDSTGPVGSIFPYTQEGARTGAGQTTKSPIMRRRVANAWGLLACLPLGCGEPAATNDGAAMPSGTTPGGFVVEPTSTDGLPAPSVGASPSVEPLPGSVPSSPDPAATPGGLIPPPGGTSVPGPDDPAPTVTPDGRACTSMPAPRGLVMLTDVQFTNGIRDTLGEEALTADNLPQEEQKEFSRKVLALNASLVFKRMDWAEDAGNSVLGRVQDVTGCSDGDRACAETYLRGLAERAYRRAVSAEEMSALMAVFDVGAESDFETAVRISVEALLASPSFFYRTEFGQANADGAVMLTSEEMASALSYLLTDRPPDDELRLDGTNGVLLDPARIAVHADRLLALEPTQVNLTSTMMAAWSFGNLAGVSKDELLYPTFNALRPRMYQEAKLFIHDVMWTRNADISELLTSPISFVDSMLAELYGVPFPGADPDEFVQVTLPEAERAGLLTRASVMSARSRTDVTSVVSRGIFVRGDLMCLPKLALPDGDPELSELIAAQNDDRTLTEKEKAESRAVTSPCSTCHSQFDVFGIPLESYDPIGRYVAQTDDTTVDLSAVARLEAGSPTASNGVELSAALAAAPQFKACVTRHMMAYGLGSDELSSESCEVAAALAELTAPTTMTDVLRAVASSEAFRMRSEEPAQ
jgi:hypothetical protein